MSEIDENYADVDITDVVDHSENFPDDTENIIFPDSTAVVIAEDVDRLNPEELDQLNSEEQVQSEKKQLSNKIEVSKPTRLPLARIKNIMKMDPDVNLVNAEAVFLVTKATELFLETIATELQVNIKKKIVSKKDLDNVFDTVDCLCFLEGAMDF